MVSFQAFRFLSLVSFLVHVQLFFWVGDAKKCPPSFNCGNLGNKIRFPFTISDRPDCGFLVIYGCDEEEPSTPKSIKHSGSFLDVVEVDHFTLTIRDEELHDLLLSNSCSVFTYALSSLPFITNNNNDFASYHLENNFTMFLCNSNNTLPKPPIESYYNYSFDHNCSDEEVFYRTSLSYREGSDDSVVSRFLNSSCKAVELPIAKNAEVVDKPLTFLSDNITIIIELSPDCDRCFYDHGGQCRLDSKGKFYCDQGKTRKVTVIVAAVVSAIGVVAIVLFLAFYLRRRYYKKKNPTHLIIEQFLEEHGHLAAKRYSYLEVKKATDSFKNKLGQGGFGSVYRGRFSDGTLVAVKVLTELNGDGEEFINEVSSISVTSHVNIVSLLGFCLEGSKRALIYEYMSNGSIDRYIQTQRDPSRINLRLTCKAIHNIAIGVARGLEYLHRGCSTRILHLDIKPHNILLDDDFCPKISDFGLAKICPMKDSIVSLLGARGTAGYIAPEVFSRNFGRVSHKSDVYSYGMMMLEIVGGRKKMNMGIEGSSEIFMPHWIHQRLESNQELTLECIKNEKDREVIKKIVIVSLWCIQIDPSNRPPMKKVVDMMEGDLELLELPPLPVISLPPISSSGTGTVSEVLNPSSFYSISLSS